MLFECMDHQKNIQIYLKMKYTSSKTVGICDIRVVKQVSCNLLSIGVKKVDAVQSAVLTGSADHSVALIDPYSQSEVSRHQKADNCRHSSYAFHCSG